MKYCAYCGAQAQDSATVCPNCGSSLGAPQTTGRTTRAARNGFYNPSTGASSAGYGTTGASAPIGYAGSTGYAAGSTGYTSGSAGYTAGSTGYTAGSAGYGGSTGYAAGSSAAGGYTAPASSYATGGTTTNVVNVNVAGTGGESYFDGGLLQYIGWSLLGGLITVLTLGICLPWAVCMIYRWETNHTVVNGHRLDFDGTGGQLFGKWILWMLLTIVTLGIYSFWIFIKLKKWQTKHTHFAN